MKRILFVDDEPRVLDGLKRMLYPYRNDWQMVFVSSAAEALQQLSQDPFDVIVTDVRMPQMSGIELLSEVVERHPHVVRMVLSGMADKDVMLPSVMLAHQYLDKPCDAATLRAAVERVFQLRVIMDNPSLKQLISRIHSLPSVPTVYTKLIQALQSDDVSPQEIGRIISQDMAMTAKILQLVNSAFFGHRRSITNPTAAVIYLGADTVRALALTVSVFSQFDSRKIPSFSIEALRDHGMAVATFARDIAKSLDLSKPEMEDAFLGGLLHELGKLVLAVNYPKQYGETLLRMEQEKISARQAELDTFGTTYADVGAYLLWLWGLPDPVTEIVARHLEPVPGATARGVVAVHVADALMGKDPEGTLNMECLSAMGLIHHLPAWKQMQKEAQSETSR
ncbi:MAG: HDOD domain-containing protein [Acidobacteriia bacterium]|nr:HDOD domain-containing protein [Terriglobia bacterium]